MIPTPAMALALLAAAALAACSSDQDPETGAPHQDGGHGHEHGPHGGHVLELGMEHLAHLEVLHDEAAGTLTVYVLGPDARTPLAADAPPELKLATAAGPRVLAMTDADGTGTAFAATDEALRGEPTGRISVTVQGKAYNPDLVHDH